MKLIVNKVVAKAASLINSSVEDRYDDLDEQDAELQRVFDEFGPEKIADNCRKFLAKLVKVLSCSDYDVDLAKSSHPGRLCDVFIYGGRPYLTAALNVQGTKPYGLRFTPEDNGAYWDANARLATSEEASRFINDIVANLDDATLCSKICTVIGNQHLEPFLASLDDEHHC